MPEQDEATPEFRNEVLKVLLRLGGSQGVEAYITPFELRQNLPPGPLTAALVWLREAVLVEQGQTPDRHRGYRLTGEGRRVAQGLGQ